MKRKLAVFCIMMLSATTILSGCGGSSDDSSSGGKTKIRFATWDVAEDVDKQQELVDKFNEEHDDIEVTLEAYGSDFDTKISRNGIRRYTGCYVHVELPGLLRWTGAA